MIIENLLQNTLKDKIKNGSTRLKPKVKMESWVNFFKQIVQIYTQKHMLLNYKVVRGWMQQEFLFRNLKTKLWLNWA